MSLKEKGKAWEELVKTHYLQQGYTLLAQNYTKRGGEIDLVVTREKKLIAVEVKTLDTIREFDDYITSRKLQALERTIEYFLQESTCVYEEISIDVVLVSQGKILEIYENVTGA